MWHIHLRKEDGQEVRHPAATLENALAVACILMRDGLDVVKLQSTDGEAIEEHVIRELCGL
jgi:hypothetical protein